VNAYAKYTPLRIALPFISGIISGISAGIELPSLFALLLSSLCLFCLLIAYYFFMMNFSLRWVPGFFSFLALFFLGYCMLTLVDQDLRPGFDREQAVEDLPGTIYLCRMEECPVEKTTYTTGNATIISGLDTNGAWIRKDIKIMLYFKDSSNSTSLGYGDLILISCIPRPIPEPANPDVFNYSRYLSYRQIYYQGYLEPNQWTQTGKVSGNPLRSGAEYCRGKLLDLLRSFQIEGQDFALSTALLIGIKDFLENDTRQEFSHAGAMHVLCVSGLHVGILYVVADKMLFFLKRNRRNRKLHQFIIILFIWTYAYITGLSASVMRAALMFSLIAAARMFKRSSESYNILAVAAFIQLWINPYEIAKVGFQLSYLAVLGIFSFYKPLDSIINPGNKIISWVWSILSVSMAAQLATFPLASFYFNLFPVYFLLTNLFVVPLAAVIIYFALALVAAGALGFTIEWLALPFKWSLRLMSGSVQMIQSFPGAVIEPIILLPEQVILIYISIIALFAYAIVMQRKMVFVLLGSLFLVFIFSSKMLFKQLKAREIIVYQVSGHTAIDLIHNRKVCFICDSSLACLTNKIDFHIMPHRMIQGGGDVKTVTLENNARIISGNIYYQYPFVFFQGKRIAIIDQDWKNDGSIECLKVNLVILKGNPRISAKELKSQLCAEFVIIDSSVPAYRAGQLMKLCEEEGILCHSVRYQGAYKATW